MKLITNSMAECFRTCPRKCAYRYIKMRRVLRKSAPLYMGQAMHQALEKWLQSGQDLGQAQKLLNNMEMEDEYNRAKLMSMMQGYHVRYRGASGVVIAIEQQFEIPLINPETGRKSQTWNVAGKIDAIVDIGGKSWIFEHKTTSEDIEVGSVYWQRLRLDSQISTYIEAAQALGYKVEGVIYDVLRKPQLRPKMATPEDKRKFNKDGSLRAGQRLEDEQPVEYMTRCMTDIAGNPDKYFARGEVLRGQLDQHEAAFDLWQTAKMAHESYKMNYWPRAPRSCFLWNSPCDYFDVCTGVASIDDNLRFRTANTEHEEL
jgi:hypothetical protein